MIPSRRTDLRTAQSEKDRAEVHVSVLVKVLAFDPVAMTVDVQPLSMERIDGTYASAAPIMGLRVACLCAGNYVIRPWYKRGDMGLIIIGDADADAVLQSGQESEPNTERNHAMEDGIFLGGICPAGKAPRGLPDDALVLAAGDNYIAISATGVTIKGNVTVSGTLSAAGVDLTAHTHAVVGGGETSEPR